MSRPPHPQEIRPGSPEPPEPSPAEADGPPPILGSWPRAYAVVAAFLALLIALFTWFTKTFQ